MPSVVSDSRSSEKRDGIMLWVEGLDWIFKWLLGFYTTYQVTNLCMYDLCSPLEGTPNEKVYSVSSSRDRGSISAVARYPSSHV